jgi:hypothetical protein
VDATTEREVLGRARQNFQARNRKEDRAWDGDGAQAAGVWVLSDGERSEFINHARHQLGVERRRALANPQTRATQVQSQGQSL